MVPLPFNISDKEDPPNIFLPHLEQSLWYSTDLLTINSAIWDRHPFNGLCSRTTWISRHQKVKSIWILMKQEMMGWQWYQLDHMQTTCTLLLTDKHASTSPLNFLEAGRSSWHPTNSDKAHVAVAYTLLFTCTAHVSCSKNVSLVCIYHRNQHKLCYVLVTASVSYRHLST